ncbi:MAG TPA: FAD-dependent oxidoreductase [Paracoccaceae bacterium]|nr:FAD-dependent oxidoreductase [Paracoccaceae bacterium]
MRKAIIIGAGINGLCTARGFLRRGWAVEIFEKGPVPNPEAASWDLHRLIRPHYADHPAYCRRIGEAFAAWAELWRDLGATHYVERGIVALSRSEGDWTERARAGFVAAGIAHEVVPGEEVGRRFPHLVSEGVRWALHTAEGGALLADRILVDLLHWLAARNVAIHPHRPALAVEPERGLVRTPQGAFQADIVVLAAGLGLPGLCPPPVPDFVPRRSTIVYAEIPADLMPLWQDAPCWVDLGGEDDLWGLPPMAGIPAKFGFGLHTRPGDPEIERATTVADTAAILGVYRGRMVGAERFRPVQTVANFYLMAPEARFLLRQDGRLVLLSADSGHGFKFGALTGEDVARAIDEGRIEEIAALLAAR